MRFNKFYLITIALLFCANIASSQESNTKSSFIIEPYIVYITGDYENRVFSDRAQSLSPPLSFGNRLELKFTKNFSLGLDVNYANVKIGWDYTYSASTSTMETADLTKGTGGKEKSVEKLRVMANVKAYFVQTESIQAYAVWGFGSRFVRQTDLITNLPVAEDRFPLTFRTGVGMKYYLTKNLGIMTEIGLGGGSPLQFGLSVRF
jgi:hypothetical protein